MKRLSLPLICIFVCTQIALAGWTVDGWVTDQYGNPARDLTVTYTYTVSNIPYSGETDDNGYYEIDYFLPVESITDVTLPDKIALYQNYPNPFNPGTVIPFDVNAPGDYSLTLYNIRGEKIRTIYSGFLQPGNYNMFWDGTSERGGGVSAGVYIYQLRTKDSYFSNKMVLLDGQGGSSSFKLGESFPNSEGINTAGGSKVNGRNVTDENEFDLEITGSYLNPNPYTQQNITLIGNLQLDYTITPPHTVSPPNQPSGPSPGMPGISYSFSTGGGSCSWNHQVDEYQFDWDGSYSSWGGSSQSHQWSSIGTYEVKARCRCSEEIVSDWSSPLSVTIQDHIVDPPNTPSGPTSGGHNVTYTFSTSGGSCNFGHPITDYRFDWDDGPYSSWGGSSQSHQWSSTGNKSVKAQCRCSAGCESDWSGSHNINIAACTVSPPSTPSGPTWLEPGDTGTYSTSGGSCNWGHPITDYRFDWGTGPYSNWGSSSQSHSWSSSSTYYVKAQCRCSAGCESSWSSSLTVHVEPHTVSAPNTPSGPSSGYVNVSYGFTAQGGSCSWGHSISSSSDYYYSWGDGTQTNWGGITQYHTWTNPNTYSVKAKCRCSAGVESGWSSYHYIDITTQSQTVSLDANEDAHVYSGDPSGTGNANFLEVGYDDGIWRILIDFPTQSIPSNVTVTFAELYLYSTSTGTGTPFPAYIGWVTSNWSESTVTWNTQPEVWYYPSNEWIMGTQSYNWLIFSIVDEIQQVLDEGYDEGIMIFAVNESGPIHQKTYHSTEASSGNDPYIIITYEITDGGSPISATDSIEIPLKVR